MKNIISTPEQVKPNFKKVKERWEMLLSKYHNSDGILNEKYLINVDCPHCTSKKNKELFTLNSFCHKTCAECNCVYVSPRLNDLALEELYADEYYSEMFNEAMIPFFDKRKELIGQSKYSQVVESLNEVSQEKKQTLRILDIGAGIGEVLSVFNDNGHNCDAIEVNPSAINHLKTLGISVYEDSFYNYQSNEKFDVIMAWGVIEHVTNPSLFLEKVYSLLNTSGVFVSEVPHSQSLLVDYCRKTGKDPLRILQGEQHIILYSNEAYIDLHKKSGLKLQKVQTNGLDFSTIININGQELNQDIVSDVQSSLDSFMLGDLLRGFWFK